MSSLIAWLRRDPRPFKLRMGAQLMAYPPKATRGTKGLAELAESIEALAPERLEALAEDGTILRVRLWDTEEGEKGGTAKAVMKGPSVADELLRILPGIATLISEAADRGALRHAEAYNMAFTKQNELVTLVAARLQALETAWVKTINQSAAERIKFSEAIADAQGSTTADPLDSMMMSMFAQRMGGGPVDPTQVAQAIQAYQAAEQAKEAAAKKSTNGATNGKAKGAKPS